MRTDIQIESRAVGQKHVRRAAPRDHSPEQVTCHFVRGQSPLTVKGTCDTEFRFDAVNPPMHNPRIGVTARLTVCRVSPTRHRVGTRTRQSSGSPVESACSVVASGSGNNASRAVPLILRNVRPGRSRSNTATSSLLESSVPLPFVVLFA